MTLFLSSMCKLHPCGLRRVIALIAICCLLTVGLVFTVVAQVKPEPLSKEEVTTLLKSNVSPKRVTELAHERGIDFVLTSDIENQLRKICRDSVHEDCTTLISVLTSLGNDSFAAHMARGDRMSEEKNWDGAIIEYREAIRLKPTSSRAHDSLGFTLGAKGDLDGLIAEEREAIRLDPANASARFNLGVAIWNKGDHEGAISMEHEAILQNPRNALAHSTLGSMLENEGNLCGAMSEYQAASTINPSDSRAKENYDRLVEIKRQKPAPAQYSVLLPPKGQEMQRKRSVTVTDRTVEVRGDAADTNLDILLKDVRRTSRLTLTLAGGKDGKEKKIAYALRVGLNKGATYDFIVVDANGEFEFAGAEATAQRLLEAVAHGVLSYCD